MVHAQLGYPTSSRKVAFERLSILYTVSRCVIISHLNLVVRTCSAVWRDESHVEPATFTASLRISVRDKSN
jgi:hypothetical protein